MAQISQPQRFEIDVDGAGYSVTSANELGLFLYREVINTYGSKQKLWEVYLLDSALNVRWRTEYLIEAAYYKLSEAFYDNKLYLLFTDTSNKNLNIVSFSVQDGIVANHQVKNFIPFSFFDFKVMNNKALIAGYFNYRPLIVLYDLETKVPKVLPGFYNDRAAIIEIKINEDSTSDVILSGTDENKYTTLFLLTFDENGDLTKTISLGAEKSRNLLFGRAQKLQEGAQLVAGVYGKRNSEYSRGVFIANINRYGEENINYYNYAEFKNFFNYMKARREQRVKSRIERKKIKNKKIRFNYRLLVHELIRHGDQYILLGEAFYPKYRTVTGNNSIFDARWSVNRGIFSMSRIFDGYRYTHAVVLGFDKEGKLLWDNSFEINDIVSFDLEQFVHANSSGNKVELLYVFNDDIRSKIIQGNDVLEGKEQHQVLPLYKSDEVESTRIDGLEKWYGNTFYTYGIQQLRNFKTDNVDLHRKVFFVNKVVFE